MTTPPTWDELREAGVEVGVIGDSGTNDFALFRQQFKERIYTALDLTDEERELVDLLEERERAARDLARLQREQWLEHAHAVAEQVSAEAERLLLPDGCTIVFDETPL